MPRVSMGYEVRRSDGTLLTRDAPSLILPTPEGAVSRMIGFSLENATPGDYELVMRFKDELSGRRLEIARALPGGFRALQQPTGTVTPRPRCCRPSGASWACAVGAGRRLAGLLLRRGPCAGGREKVPSSPPAPTAPITRRRPARRAGVAGGARRRRLPPARPRPGAAGHGADRAAPPVRRPRALRRGAARRRRARTGSSASSPAATASPRPTRFTLYLDPHRDRRTGVVLQVSAAGVQRDAAIYDDNFEDDTWDAVWESAVTCDGRRLDGRDAGPLLAAPLPHGPRPRLGRERAPRRAPQERELVARPRAQERERPRVAHGGPRGHRRDRARPPPRAAALRLGPRRVRRAATAAATPGTTARASSAAPGSTSSTASAPA